MKLNSHLVGQQEKKEFRLLFLHSFLIGLAGSLFFVEASRSFILKVSIAEMPSAYIVSGLAGYLLVRLYKKLQARFGVIRSFDAILVIFLLSMIALFAGKAIFAGNALLIQLLAYIGFVLMFAFATLFAVGFAGIALSLLNPLQSKRFIALLGTGEIIASIIGYALAPLLIALLHSDNYLLLLSAFFALLSIWPVWRLKAVNGAAFSLSGGHAATAPAKFNLAFIRSNPFILYLSLTTLFSIVSVYFIDYSYLISVRYFSQTTGIEVADVVAVLFTLIKTGELLFSFFSSSILASAGTKKAVLLLPWLLILGCIMAILSVIFFSANPLFIIAFLFINKWVDRVIRKGITIPAMKVMFEVNSPEERVQLQNNIDGVISQLSTIVCGVLLTAICFFVSAKNHNQFLTATTLVCLAVFAGFLFMSARLIGSYNYKLREYLSSRRAVSLCENNGVPPDVEPGDAENLIRQCISDILRTEAAIGNLTTPADPDMVTQLAVHRAGLIQLLLGLLQLQHHKPSIQLISDILNKEDPAQEEIFFAVELLESTLQAKYKKMVLPVFEPATFEGRRKIKGVTKGKV